MRWCTGILLVGLSLLAISEAVVIVSTRSGPIRGKLSDSGPIVTSFKGIPYAQPPVGNLRFEKPRPVTPWTAIFDANKIGPQCMQPKLPISMSASAMSEDCLTLNIWVPGNLSWSEPKPVMLFIHGGGLLIGSGGSYLYDGSRLASSGDVIVVTLNYRLGIFGFMTSAGAAPANLGLWDQHTAITWIHENIASFGGDVNRVTIFGQSAGSWSVAHQLISPHNNVTRFQRAILQSGGLICPQIMGDPHHNDALEVAEWFECDTSSNRKVVHCLKGIPAQRLLNAVSVAKKFYLPVVDGDFITRDGYQILEGYVMRGANSVKRNIGNFAGYDLLLGFNSQEGLMLFGQHPTAGVGIPASRWEESMKKYVMMMNFKSDYGRNLLSNMAGSVYASKIPEGIAGRSGNDQRLRMLSDIYGDYGLSWPTLEIALLHDATTTDRKTYVYVFDHKRSTPIGFTNQGPAWLRTGADHGEELVYVFGSVFDEDVLSGKNFTNDEKALSLAMMTYWTNFARAGNPSSHQMKSRGGVTWPVFSDDSRMYLRLTTREDEFAVKPLGGAAEVFRAATVGYRMTERGEYDNDESNSASDVSPFHSILLLVPLLNRVF